MTVSTVGAIIHSHNAHFNSTGMYDGDEGGTATNTTGDPFVDSTNGDYRLGLGGAVINPGKVLSVPFNIDINGAMIKYPLSKPNKELLI